MSVISVTTSFSPSSTSSLASSTSSAPSATTASSSAAAAITTPLKNLHDISCMTMDFQSAMETFAEAWVAANAKTGHHLVSGGSAGLAGLGGIPGLGGDNNIQSHGMALTRPQQCRTPPAAHAITTHTAASLATAATVQLSSNNQQQQLSLTTSAIPTTTIVNNNNMNNNNNNKNNNSNSSCHGRDSTSPPDRVAVSVAAHKGGPDHDSSPRDLTGVGASSSDTPPPIAMLSVKEEPGNDSMKQNGKSLPIHCIVESICMLDESRFASCISNTQTQTSHQIATSGTNPTYVNVNMGTGGTATPGTQSSSPWRRRSIVEVDSFVIIPASTSFHDLVQVALLRLGYGPESAAAAKATVVIKNWKPLNFEQISEDPLACVGDILGDLTSVVTLKMQVFRGRPGALVDIKDKLLRFLLVQSHGLLVSAGCPLDELILSQICRLPVGGGGSLADITDDCRRKFDHWWHAQLNPHSPSTVSRTPAPATPHLSAPTTPVKANDLSQHTQPNRHLPEPPNRTPTNSAPISHLHAPLPVHNSVHPSLVQPMHGNPFPAAQQKTRMRTSFDPELELPKLQRWFADNQHPSRQQIQQYVKELNGLESRRGRKPLDVNNVVYWFKNARAAQKRAEIRGVGGVGLGTGMPHLSVNGYSGHSPTNGSGYLLADGYLNSERMMLDHRLKGNYGRSGGSSGSVVRLNLSQGMDEYSNAGSDLDEEDMTEGNGTPSPVAPLSLTTSRKDDSRDPSPRAITPKSQVEQSNFPKQEPINYHSPDHSNNNKTVTSDGDDGDDMEVVEDSTDAKNFSGAPMFRSSSVSSYTRSISPNDFLRQTAVAAAVAAAANNESECIERLAAAFPIGSNSMFGHSIMYMSQYIPSLGHHAHHPNATSPPNATSASMALSALSADERRKRNRTFIDPVTEVPRLEQWFSLNTHPSHNLILKYTEELNCMAYRQKFPRLEPKNVQFWFKNRRAKCKRLKMSLFESPSAGHYHHSEDKE